MALTEKTAGELALFFLKEKLAKEGLNLKPKEVKREVMSWAKKSNFSVAEIAEFYTLLLNFMNENMEKELNEMILGKVK